MTRLVLRNLRKHPIRSLLTIGSLTVAVFLLCTLRSLVTTLNLGVEAAESRRLWVQSAVSLFVDLPPSYETKLENVEGVAQVCKWQWFGGYYQERANFFAQFAVNPDTLFSMWPEMEIVDGTVEAFRANRAGCVVGEALAREYGWNLGDDVPILSPFFPRPGLDPWVFRIEAIYRPKKPSLDPNTLFFQWDYFEKSVEELEGISPNVGVYALEVAPGADATSVMATVDGMFENGPQRVQTTTESEFNRQFVEMVGNVPRLVGFIGMGVFLAIVLACVNTMLMAAREQTHDIGILKALGFSDGRMFGYLLGQSVVLCGLGGAAGIALALVTQGGIAAALGTAFPGYTVLPSTLVGAAVFTLGVGVLAGLVPGWRARNLQSVDALRAEK